MGNEGICCSVLFYPGFDVLPPIVVYRTGRMDDARFEQLQLEIVERFETLQTAAPIAYRVQNQGDYEIPALELKEGLGVGRSGLDIHLRD